MKYIYISTLRKIELLWWTQKSDEQRYEVRNGKWEMKAKSVMGFPVSEWMQSQLHVYICMYNIIKSVYK